ncbi:MULTISPECIES: hypothetical protein [unclassified Streptomyces]|uniref:hypothetical protein n=1 Tax=unclassified Streptomyces TaxID=2593676 RepID=UPI00081E3FE8|nr:MULTISPECIES: hypothetical protein [unclassified Streptomyces]MYZ37500.1 hypothetical protein [Streptomyces sp. SID4917]SCF91808.1 hypothetical protein GA0115259_104826 [Streptomyces sp. MnatMP-M17]
MNTTNPTTTLFGPDRHRLGYEDQEWSVWVSGMDEIHDRETLGGALNLANELNATFAQMRFNSTSEYDPVMYAVVLHHGYAWTADTEHRLGKDCGIKACGPCSANRS